MEIEHYLFEDDETGEEFIVGAKDIKEAYRIAHLYFDIPKYQYIISEIEAENSGLDEY